MVNAILGVIGTILYPLFSIIFLLIQILQNLFYAFAGIGTVYINDTGNGFLGLGTGTPVTGENTGDKNDTGILYYLFQSDIIKNALISMAILALFLLVIFTTLAFIKTIYSDKPKNWKDIITNSIKGLTNFIVLPVCCLLGVWVGNILLQAINGATSQGGSFYMDRKLFICSAYNANIYRGDGAFDSSDTAKSNDAYNKIKSTIDSYPCLKEAGIKVEQGKDSNYYAQIVDEMFSVSNDKGSISIYEQFSVGPYYRLYDINYLFIIVGGIFMMYVLVNVTYGMIKRMFILLMLFIISPAICAMYPLDEGNAVKSWSGDVKKNILSAYGAVAGMNLFFSIAPIIQTIKVGGSSFSASVTSDIVQLIILICGLFTVNDFISMISTYVGGGNAFADGKSIRGQAQGALKKYGKSTVERGVKVGGAFVRGNEARKQYQQSLKDEGVGNSFTRFMRGSLKGSESIAKEGGAGLINSLNKAGADTLGLKSKDIKADDLTFKKDMFTKIWEGGAIGGAIAADKKTRADAKEEAEAKKVKDAFKKLFEDQKDKSGAVTKDGDWRQIFDGNNFKGGQEGVDASNSKLKTYDSALLKNLSDAEDAGYSREEFVKMLSKSSGKTTTEINAEIKKEQSNKAKIDKYNDAVNEKEIQDAIGGNKIPESVLSSDSIDSLTESLKTALSQIFNGQSNSGTKATDLKISGKANLSAALSNSMNQMANRIVGSLAELKREVKEVGNPIKAKDSSSLESLSKEIHSLRDAMQKAQPQAGSQSKDFEQVIKLLNQILNNLKQ